MIVDKDKSTVTRELTLPSPRELMRTDPDAREQIVELLRRGRSGIIKTKEGLELKVVIIGAPEEGESK